MFWTHRNNSQEDLTEHLLSEDFEMTDQSSKMIVHANVVQSPAAAPSASRAPGAANWFRKLRGMDDSNEKPFIADLAESETGSHNLANDEPGKADDADIVGTCLQKYYAPIDTYEGRGRYDPRARWTPEEEKRLARRLDWRIRSWCCLMFFALQLDRGNITQALSDNVFADLKLNTNSYNTGQNIFYLTFLAAELPSQLVSKKIGPDNWSMAMLKCVRTPSDSR